MAGKSEGPPRASTALDFREVFSEWPSEGPRPRAAAPRETHDHEEEDTMAHDPTPADIRAAKQREDEEQWSPARLQEERQRRRDLQFRLPMGRALDHADLASLIDEGNQTTRAIVMRRRLLVYALSQ